MTSLLSMFDCIDLSDESLRTLVAYKREDGRVNVFVLAFADFSELKDTLVGFFIGG